MSKDTPNIQFQETYSDEQKILMHYIATNKEKLVAAWLAETGLMPSESVLVQKWDNGEFRTWIEKKTDKDKIKL